MANYSGAKAERGAGGRGAGAGVVEIGMGGERIFRRSRSVHMLRI